MRGVSVGESLAREVEVILTRKLKGKSSNVARIILDFHRVFAAFRDVSCSAAIDPDIMQLLSSLNNVARRARTSALDEQVSSQIGSKKTAKLNSHKRSCGFLQNGNRPEDPAHQNCPFC